MKKLRKLKDGGKPKVDTSDSVVMKAMMKGKMAYADAMGNPDAHRMVQNYPQQYMFTGNEQIPGNFEHPPAGAIGSHYMGSYGNYAIPSIQQSGDSLRFNPNPRPSDKGAMKFNSEPEAEYFAEHYKDVAPMMRNWEMRNGGNNNYNFADMKKQTKPQAILPFMMPAMDPVQMPVMINQNATTTYPIYTHGGYHAELGYYYNGQEMGKAHGSGTYDMGTGTYFKDGGIHIKESTKGSLHKHLGVPEGKKIPASKLAIKESDSPAIRKKKQFAINARKFNHEQGGMVNPFSPMHKFLNGGEEQLAGFQGAQKAGIGAFGNNSAYNTNANTPEQQQQQSAQNTAQTMVNPDQANNMERDSYLNHNVPYVTSDALTPGGSGTLPNQQQRRQPYGQDFGNILGAGLATASFFADKKNQRNAQMYQQQMGMSANQPHYNNPFAHGQTDQYGNYRNMGPSQSAQMRYSKNGGYVKGGTYDIDEKTVNELIRQGYQIERL